MRENEVAAGSAPSRLQEKAERLSQETFLGGPLGVFESAGRMQLIALLREGVYPDSTVLDVGCGCLRAGYWLIHFLEPGRYFGIEPNRWMLEAGVRHLLEPGLVESKRPRFDSNPDFDFSVFGETFDFVLARSIWTHAAKDQIRKMLDGFAAHARPGGVFLASYRRAGLFRRDYRGRHWVGRSHESESPGMVAHRFGWVREECRVRGLGVGEIRDGAYNFGGQRWLRITKRGRS